MEGFYVSEWSVNGSKDRSVRSPADYYEIHVPVLDTIQNNSDNFILKNGIVELENDHNPF
ncbi:hypothetical protein MHH81_03580 [Psychrobacillus sp. FSL H8-0484]|uniref:hypothetical protein n=1 Tax=Psychrobacillus sp. FSL H8-0484 TaxID=2921390 RepID=UPI0030F7309A